MEFGRVLFRSEIARSEQPWGYVKDCPPFSQYVEEEKTVNLSPEEVTSVTQPGVKGYTAPPVSSKPLPPKLKEVPLSPKPIEMVPLYKRRWRSEERRVGKECRSRW